MNQHQDDRLFERLADGELHGDEYHRLIASLDDRPDGWKRCALALLEAQALSGELSAIVRETSAVQSAPKEQPAVPSRGGRRVRLPTLLLAVAASFLIAFGLGVWLRGGMSTFERDANIAEDGTPNHDGKIEVALPKPEGDEAANQFTTVGNSDTLPRGRMTLLVDDGTGRKNEIQLPVYDESQIDASWLAQDEISPDVMQSLRQEGFDLRRDRQFVPFEIDGRQVVVPMEQVEIVPVSVTYQ